MLIKCLCGEVYAAGEHNRGQWLRCHCGRIVEVPRPAKTTTQGARRGRTVAVRQSPTRTERDGFLDQTEPIRAVRSQVRALVRRWLVGLSWGYVAAVLVAWAVMRTLSDRWWPATVFLFGPRWVLLLPLVVLIPGAAVLKARLVAPLLIAAGIVVVPVMGFRFARLPWSGSDAPANGMRVVTLNAGAAQGLALELPFRLEHWRPDIVALQECRGALADTVRALSGWYGHAENQLCLLSRYPIREASMISWADLEPARNAGIGGSGRAAQYVIEAPQGSIRLVNLHLETAREGLVGVFELNFRRVKENIMLREVESRRTRDWIGKPDRSLIVVGDFNMPVESAIYRTYWSDFQNAFSDAGFGFGMTKDNSWIQIRIDHVLSGPAWRTKHAAVGPVVGLDHRPVIADLAPVGARR